MTCIPKSPCSCCMVLLHYLVCLSCQPPENQEKSSGVRTRIRTKLNQHMTKQTQSTYDAGPGFKPTTLRRRDAYLRGERLSGDSVEQLKLKKRSLKHGDLASERRKSHFRESFETFPGRMLAEGLIFMEG